VGGGVGKRISLPAAGHDETAEVSVELPAPFTLIESRSPVVGDHVVTLGYCYEWMGNSYGRVVAVNCENSTASIHFSCGSVYDLSFAETNKNFVICGIAQLDAQQPVPPDASGAAAASLQSSTETDAKPKLKRSTAFPYLTLCIAVVVAAWLLLRLRESDS
jgi:hypothetical protein